MSAITPLADAAKDEAIEILRTLLRFDTTNPPGNEKPAIDYLAGLLRKEGIEPKLFEPAPGRANLVARPRGDGSAPPLLLTSHVDVVTAEPARWTHGPFSGDVEGGYVFGRGAVDMKGMPAMEVATFLALKRAGVKLKRDVILLALADEEAGMEWGSKWMVENQPDEIRAEFALNEVGGFSSVVGGKRLYLVGMGEKGVCWLKLRAKGDPGHGSMPHDRNAVLRLARAVAALADTRLSSDVRPSARAFFEEVAKALGKPLSFVIQGLLQPLTREASLRALAMADKEQARIFRCMLYQTCSPTCLAAGKKENVIPSAAEAVIDGRFLPGTSRDGFVREVQRAVGPDIEVEVIHSGEPTEVAIDAPIFRTIAAKTAAHDPEARAVPWLNVGFTDATHLSRIGVKCYGFYPLKLPPDLRFASLFHGHDERVPLEGYRFGLSLFHDVVRSFATGEGA
ncbi:MAG TPA: M20/M25/M40 family metallo-hydrolase [Planctomycetota bacterium]|nr:M20/M25/M40 family metallo-hydrolase [Planctomycetota bacterium]